MKNIECAVFDKDGTLLDFSKLWIPVAEKSIMDICTLFNAPDCTYSHIMKNIGVENGKVSINGPLCFGTYRDVCNAVCETLCQDGIKFDREKVFVRAPAAFAENMGAGEICPTSADLGECLARMKSKRIHLFVVTSDNAQLTSECLCKLGFENLFDEILCDDGVHPAKPDPYYINYLVRKYGFDRSEMCMVGDTPIDMIFASNGGIRGYGVGTDGESTAILKKYTDVVCESISALAEAGYFGDI